MVLSPHGGDGKNRAMASAQAMEEELQQSVMLSTDGEYGTPDPGAEDSTSLAQSPPGTADSAKQKMATSEDDEDLSEQDASGEDLDEDMGEDVGDLAADTKRSIHIIVNVRSRRHGIDIEDYEMDMDHDAEEDDDSDVQPSLREEGEGEEEEEEEGEEEEDGEEGEGEEVEVEEEEEEDGEEEEEEEEDQGQDEDREEVDDEDQHEDEDESDDEDEEMDNADEEAVGAVKIKPGGSDYAESEVSDLRSAANDDSDSAANDVEDDDDDDEEPGWRENQMAEGEDDESETGPAGICTFCKQDEENDPSEDFESFLVCGICGDNAHQQCARQAAAMSEKNNAQDWKCPECDDNLVESDLRDAEGEDASMNEDLGPEPKLSEEAIQEEKEKEEEEEEEEERNIVQGQTTTDIDDACLLTNDTIIASTDTSAATGDGLRTLRKRKTSSVEANESGLPLRRRRRNGSVDHASNTGDNEGRTSVESGKVAGSTRSSRQKTSRSLHVSVERKSRTSLILKFQVQPESLREIIGRKRRIQKRPNATGRTPRAPNATSARRAAAAAASTEPDSIMPTPFTTESYSQPFYSFFDKETEDMKGKPYGGILTEAEADTSKTLPQPDDRRRFDQAKQRAEDEWRARILTMQAEMEMPMKRTKKSNDNASHIECIEFGGWEIDTWYAAPYPAEYSRNRVLYICEFCLKYMNSDYVAWRHKLKCGAKHPPGDEIYRHASISVFEVDGRKNPVYCQNLCLLAKLFLGSKTLYYDVEPFLFYVLCEYDDCGYHFVGYFSKEKRASSQNNVSCILTLPIHQRKGYGNLLIDFSYLLTQVEEKTGSPEKPLSDMGLVSYRNYWRLRLCRYFLETMGGDKHKTEGLSIRQISDDTGMTPDDVIAALEGLRALARDPQTKMYAFRIDLEYCRQYVAKWEAKGYVQLKPEALAWTPYVMGRSNAVNFELGPPINAMVSREDEEARLDEGPNGMHGLNSLHGGLNGVNGVNGVNGQPVLPHDAGMGLPGLGLANSHEDNSNNENNDELEKPAPPELTPMLSIEKLTPDNRIAPGPQDTEMKDVAADADGEASLAMRYRDIPPSRFEVFPPITGGRRGGAGADRSRQTIGAPLAPRIASTPRPRPPPKRAGTTARRAPAASRPKPTSSAAARKKTGGTGRGPGRWPKGTKKSDYGNAESGPGLPPGWEERHARFRVVSDIKDTSGPDQAPTAAAALPADEQPTMDEVHVADGIVVGGSSSTGDTCPKGKVNGGHDEPSGASGPSRTAVRDPDGGDQGDHE